MPLVTTAAPTMPVRLRGEADADRGPRRGDCASTSRGVLAQRHSTRTGSACVSPSQRIYTRGHCLLISVASAHRRIQLDVSQREQASKDKPLVLATGSAYCFKACIVPVAMQIMAIAQ